MMKFKTTIAVALSLALSASANAWDLWDQFKASNYDSGRIIDFNDRRLITTSEGQSYAMFFSLVAGDKESFQELFEWTEKNLGADQPAWLWGIADGRRNHAGKILDTNNATDSDMWIAYCLLEAARLWDEPTYKEKAELYLERLKELVREIPTIGSVLLPGRVGFEDKGVVTLNPSYYPIFILRRFVEEDSSFWLPVLEGSVAAIIRSSPNGAVADWSKFDSTGKLLEPDKMVGSYNAIRTYLWAGIMSPKDPIYGQLADHFAPMIESVKQTNIPPEEIKVMDMTVGENSNVSFGACFLPYIGADKSGSLIRTLLTRTVMQGDGYYGNCLAVFGLGFDNQSYSFDEKGRLIISTNLKLSEPATGIDFSKVPEAPEPEEEEETDITSETEGGEEGIEAGTSEVPDAEAPAESEEPAKTEESTEPPKAEESAEPPEEAKESAEKTEETIEAGTSEVPDVEAPAESEEPAKAEEETEAPKAEEASGSTEPAEETKEPEPAKASDPAEGTKAEEPKPSEEEK